LVLLFWFCFFGSAFLVLLFGVLFFVPDAESFVLLPLRRPGNGILHRGATVPVCTKRLRPVIGRSLRIRFTTCYTARFRHGYPSGSYASPPNGGMPSATTGGASAPSFCPGCSEVIFMAPLPAPVFHPHRLAMAFLKPLLSSSLHLFLYDCHYSQRIFNCQDFLCWKPRQIMIFCLQ